MTIKKLTKLALGVSLLVMAGTSIAELHINGRFFKDEKERTVILRGINVAANSKVPPFTPLADLSVLEPLKDLGFNTIRLLFNWEAFEGTRGEYNEDYLNYYTSAVKWAEDNDFYIVVDIHQDAFSRFSVNGCGEGFPRWALPPDVRPATPKNDYSCRNWAIWMIIDRSMHKSWRHFYANSYGVRDHYLDMMAALAARLASYPNVIGYDLLNEPWGDEVKEIYPLYQAATARLREHHPAAMMFLNPHVLIGSGMAQSKLPKPDFTNYVYAPHYYDATVVGILAWLGVSAEGVVNKMQQKAKELAAPLFLGEFGAPAAAMRGSAYIQHIYDLLDTNLLSGAQWAYSPQWNPRDRDGWNDEDLSILDDQYRLRANYQPRPHWQKIAGSKPKVTHSPLKQGTRVTTLTWLHDPAQGSTEIYIPPKHLMPAKNAVQVSISPDTKLCDFDNSKNRLSCQTDEEQVITVRLKYNSGG